MQMRKLGKSGLRSRPLALGGNVFGWTADEAMSFKLLDAYVAAGGNFIDTADTYSRWAPGTSGRGVGDRHRQVAQAARQPREGGHRHQGRCGDGAGPQGSEAGLHLQSVEQSLRVCRPTTSTCTSPTGTIPTHRSRRRWPPMPSWSPRAKVRVIGASNFTAERLTVAEGQPPARLAPYQACSPTTTCASAQTTSATSSRVPARGGRRHSLLLAGGRISPASTAQRPISPRARAGRA